MVTTGLAALTLAGITGPAQAMFFGNFFDDRLPAIAPAPQQPARPKPAGPSVKHKRAIEREEAKRPNELKAKAGAGPLQIVVSLDHQKLVLYSNGVAIAESKVSTGVATHPTPIGIFSIIQKNRWHRSNLYSNAPMPYMQRITWSGVALHEGIVPGRPASHGCIRLPQAFAQQLWGVTKLGARVIVTRGEVAPVEFTHPRLAALTRKSDPLISKQNEDGKPKPAGETSTPRVEPRAELRNPVQTPSAARTKTASVSLTVTDASAEEEAAPAATETAAVSDPIETTTFIEVDTPPYPPAVSFESSAPAKEPAAPAQEARAANIAVSDYPPTLVLDVALPQAKASVAVSNYPPALAFEVALPRDPATFALDAPLLAAELPDYPPPLVLDLAATDERPAQTAATEIPAPDYPPSIVFDAALDTADPVTTASVAVPAKTADAPAAPPAAAERGEAEKAATAAQPTDVVATPTDIPAPADVATVAEPLVKPGPVSVFISRKDRKLYVRQGFAPVFDAPVTIERPDLPLGTHIFTAMAISDDGASVRWSALTMPPPAHKKVEPDAARPSNKRAKSQPAEENHPYPNAAEAIERVTVPQEIAERIFAFMAPGSSLIVSDQGLGPETGRGTDFIVLTR